MGYGDFAKTGAATQFPIMTRSLRSLPVQPTAARMVVLLVISAAENLLLSKASRLQSVSNCRRIWWPLEVDHGQDMQTRTAAAMVPPQHLQQQYAMLKEQDPSQNQ